MRPVFSGWCKREETLYEVRTLRCNTQANTCNRKEDDTGKSSKRKSVYFTFVTDLAGVRLIVTCVGDHVSYLDFSDNEE
jgi:hypothetical protein